MDIAAALHARQRMLQIKASAGSGKTYTLTRLFRRRRGGGRLSCPA